MKNKPSWDNAPPWANFLTRDADGWYWWESRPYLTFQSAGDGGKFQEADGAYDDGDDIRFERRR